MIDMAHKNLLSVLGVARAVSVRGGLTLRDAVARSGFANLCSSLDTESLIPLLRSDPNLVKEWLMYSENKRTSGGWYVKEPGEIGEPATGVSMQFPSMESAVANFVV